MDPSGIIGIIGVAGQILATCTKLGLNWRDAPGDAKKFKSEVDGLQKTLWESYNHLIQNPDFISAFEGKHSAVLSNLAAPSNSDDSALLFTCKEELEDVLESLQKRLGGSRFGWERLKAAFSNEKTQSAIENVQRRCQDINSKILIDNTAIALNTNLEVRSTRKDLDERHLDEKKKQILNWITPIDFAAQQIDNLERRQEGTGQWLLESPEFQNWIKEDRKTLFCPGIPGAGKTMLSSIVIDHLQDRFGQDPAVGIAYSENVNIFATSRHIPEIESHFEDAPSVEIRATDEDVTEFLDGHMYKLPQAVRKSTQLQGEVKHSIVQAVQGMFLLAQLYLDSLQGKRSAKSIKEALRKFSSGHTAYDIAYEEAMERIEGQLEEQKTLAKDALSWILDWTKTTSPIWKILCVCAGLITIDEESEVIRLVHYTTQEFFERTAERWLPNAQELIVESCVTYLSFDALSRDAYDSDSELNAGPGVTTYDLRQWRSPLYDYAATEWGKHARNISPPSEGLLSFLMGREANLDAAADVIWSFDSDIAYEMDVTGVSGLHLAAFFGLREAFTIVLERYGVEADINIEDSRELTPLSYAVMGGRVDFVEWLLSKDEIDVDSK
ncbi:hypothetical protein CGCA056_v013023 [Colletotrichum aenigma]|uniref:uncharacterized protein n=1 Tax=Colletotrichum aenigma TaxID=1215731 RepID=UPI001872A0C6|nr:uncharacterized protein CGCA056_v013023 [Colletotrichum aenigma]KAF5506983.1 hypothetical protein CGCA056_v013023 [Colletotrichum aenigma]